MSWAYRCMIVINQHVALARELAATLAPVSGAAMWNTPLFVAIDTPPSHWISNGPISAEFAYLLPLTEFDEEGVAKTTPGQVELAVKLATAEGMLTDVEQVQALFDTSTVTLDGDPFAAINRLNLSLIGSSKQQL